MTHFSPMMTSEQLEHAADCLRILAHPQRLALIQLLQNQSQTVGELASACKLSPAVASGHLRLLQRSGLLALRRDSRRVYYSISDSCLAELMKCLQLHFRQD